MSRTFAIDICYRITITCGRVKKGIRCVNTGAGEEVGANKVVLRTKRETIIRLIDSFAILVAQKRWSCNTQDCGTTESGQMK